jgi:hypothetical protein
LVLLITGVVKIFLAKIPTMLIIISKNYGCTKTSSRFPLASNSSAKALGVVTICFICYLMILEPGGFESAEPWIVGFSRNFLFLELPDEL